MLCTMCMIYLDFFPCFFPILLTFIKTHMHVKFEGKDGIFGHQINGNRKYYDLNKLIVGAKLLNTKYLLKIMTKVEKKYKIIF